MRIDIGYILGHLCELLLFFYFANTSFYPRKSYTKSNIISLCSYIILSLIGLLGQSSISILSFFVINVALLKYCYNVKLKSAIFYSIVLDMLSVVGEYIIGYLVGVNLDNLAAVTPHQSMAVTTGGKLVYLIGIIFLKHFTNKEITYDNEFQIILAVIPLLTIVCVTIMVRNKMDNFLFYVVCMLYLIINFITFYINARINDKNRKLQILQEEYDRNKADLSAYRLLEEKYENTRIMRHDFHKQLNVLNDLIEKNNIKAKEYMKEMQFAQRELDYSQYTDNKILNILFDQKIKECHTRGIEIHIHSKYPTLSFISEIDTVAIFSNMLDNAIEAAEQAETKEIYVDLYTVNNSYSAVKIENYTDKEPIIVDGLLSTQKKNKDIHGIGIRSINNSLKKYNSELTWNYDKENKFFRTMVLIHIPPENNH